MNERQFDPEERGGKRAPLPAMGSSAPPLQWTQQKREGDSGQGEGLEDLPMAERMKALNITTEEPQEGKKKLELKITIVNMYIFFSY